MSEQRPEAEEVLQELESFEGMNLDDDIIDVSALDFNDHERWLDAPAEYSSECRVQNIRTWLRSEPDSTSVDNESSNGAKKSIDTRTFTRPKKRTNRTSFEAIMEAISPSFPNVWRTQSPGISGNNLNMDKDQYGSNNSRESVPAMLRPTSTAVTGHSSANSMTSGQESMEAFLNMSQSKGIDSFINLIAPEFADSLIMNMSQSTDLNNSLLSMARDGSLSNEGHANILDSQILTDSMMQNSMFGDVPDVQNFSEFFAKDNENDTMLHSLSNSSSLADKTLIGKFETTGLSSKFDTYTRRSVTPSSSYSLPLDVERHKINATFSPSPFTNEFDTVRTLLKSQNKENKVLNSLNDTFQMYNSRLGTVNVTVDIRNDVPKREFGEGAYLESEENRSAKITPQKSHGTVLNSTFNGTTDLRRQLLEEVQRSTEKKLNSTYNEIPKNYDGDISVSAGRKLDPTCNHIVKNCDDDSPRNIVKKLEFTYDHHANNCDSDIRMSAGEKLDSTYNHTVNNCDSDTPVSTGKKLDSTYNHTINNIDAGNPLNIGKKLDSTYNHIINNCDGDIPVMTEKILDSTYNHPINNCAGDVSITAHKTFDSSYNYTSNNCDLPLATGKISDSSNTHSAQNSEVDIPTKNPYNTYRKDPATVQNKGPNNLVDGVVSSNHIDERKYYTFTKKSNPADARKEGETKQSVGHLNNAFSKAPPRYQRKLRSPRVLSKLPQLFQKSNPNLASSSMKTINMGSYTNIPGARYIDRSQPDIPRNVEGSVVSKLFPLGRIKSGSEQRLMDVGGSTRDLKIQGACGSTESIESTQSAHSAPDLDDRLSICSDSSHNSYNMRTMNMDQLHRIARMQEESLGQVSTPIPHVLENTWIEAEKDLPSPIPKNGTRGPGSGNSSPRSTKFAVKTSSPLLSPTGSNQSINNAGNHINDVTHVMEHQAQYTGANKPEMFVKPTKYIGAESKTRLKPPTNWGTANRPSDVGSGIPRPATRIPAPRFARPNAKSNQANWKKGYL